MKWKELLGRRPVASDAPTAPVPASAPPGPPPVPVPAGCTLFHVTHWKAASQWMRAILNNLFGPAVSPTEFSLWGSPIETGRVYANAYISKPEFDVLELPGQARCLVLIRDLRDTLTSGYFSLRYSHGLKHDDMVGLRLLLNRLNQEEGMLYLLDTWLNLSARIQRTWLEAGTPCYKIEEVVQNPAVMLGRLFREQWGVTVDPARLEAVTARHSFAAMTGGRPPGQEDVQSHYRKGVAGDWRNHFTPRISRRFDQLCGDLLVQAGYEPAPRQPADSKTVSVPSVSSC